MWDILWYIMLIPYLIACVGLVVVVLLQKGKGVGFAGAFGMGGGSDTIFGPRAGKSLPQRLTYGAAAAFMILAFAMSLISGRLGKGEAPERAAEEISAAAQEDLQNIEGLGSAVGEDLETTTPAPEETAPATTTPVEGGSVTVTPATPAEAPAEGGSVTVTPVVPAEGGTVTVTPVAPEATPEAAAPEAAPAETAPSEPAEDHGAPGNPADAN